MAESSNSASNSASSENTEKPPAESSSSSNTSTSSPSQQQQQQQQICANCTNPSPDPETKPLKDCAKCHSVLYCGKECQKADFKAHKKVCARLAQEYASTHEPRVAASRAPPKQGGGGRGLQKWQFDT